MIAHVSGIYDEPDLYQLACAYRDVPAEATALLNWCGEYWQNGQVGSVLELAAGPAEHARELAARGLRAAALDLSGAMCAYAARRAEAAGLALDVYEADMRDFSVPRQFDLAIIMLNSACHLFTLDDLVANLRAVAAHVVPGGLYVIELAHPADYLSPDLRTSNTWTIESDGVVADVTWGGREDPIDPVTQITREHMSITARYADGTIRTASDVVPNRFWTATEMTAAIRLAGGFTTMATYGDFDTSTRLDDKSAWRMILILRRE
ncbi:MAG TPA: class I SAM-dependent methyltransferase [Trebonia sp.]|nr:class I SAM-dependent methyltransferase [Trebonia sp.]